MVCGVAGVAKGLAGVIFSFNGEAGTRESLGILTGETNTVREKNPVVFVGDGGTKVVSDSSSGSTALRIGWRVDRASVARGVSLFIFEGDDGRGLSYPSSGSGTARLGFVRTDEVVTVCGVSAFLFEGDGGGASDPSSSSRSRLGFLRAGESPVSGNLRFAEVPIVRMKARGMAFTESTEVCFGRVLDGESINSSSLSPPSSLKLLTRLLPRFGLPFSFGTSFEFVAFNGS